jgi:hypothetical protein
MVAPHSQSLLRNFLFEAGRQSQMPAQQSYFLVSTTKILKSLAYHFADILAKGSAVRALRPSKLAMNV